MYNYYFVNLKVAPKMAALLEAEKSLAETERTLAEAMEKLRDVEMGIEQLQILLREEEQTKAELEREKQLCEDRLNRAVRLIAGLSEEQQRWVLTAKNIEIALQNVVGDILLSAGTFLIVYCHIQLIIRQSSKKKANTQTGGGRYFERPNVERLIFRNLKITGEAQNFEQVKF